MGKDGISIVFVSPCKVNYYRIGARNAHVHTESTHLIAWPGANALAQAANSPQQRQLLEQVRLGESTQREDLVRQSLYRLELIDPNNPDVIAARFRYLLRQGDTAGAQKSWIA